MKTVHKDISNRYSKVYFNKLILLLMSNDSYMSKEEIYEYIKDELGTLNRKIIDKVLNYLMDIDYIEQIGIRYKVNN
jgi:hypothetical protein